MSQPKDIFKQRVAALSKELQSKTATHKSLSILRIVVFIILVVAVVYAANIRSGLLLSAVCGIGFLGFSLLIRTHNRIRFVRKTTKNLIQINQEEIQRLEGNFSTLNHGSVFAEKGHNYAHDLDVFGSNSLFQLVVRSRMIPTQKLAAKWLTTHAPAEEILERQEAVKELTNNIDWRQQYTALGMHQNLTEDQSDSHQRFLDWLQGDSRFLKSPFWQILSGVIPLTSLALGVLILGFSFPYQLIFIPILLNLYFLRVTFVPLLDITQQFDAAAKSLNAYEKLIEQVEARTFSAQKLTKLRGALLTDSGSASSAVKALRRILLQLLNRANILYFPLNMVFLLDLIWLLKAEKWRKNYGSQMKNWLDSVHEIDVLNDMAGVAAAHPDFVFPTLAKTSHTLVAKQLGHPLIPATGRITNDFELIGKGQVALVTGSNMSGKSTFLRTVGVGLVMAQCGLPVCAHSFTFSPLTVFTSMRTEDNLEESISSFYAELSRIKLLLDSLGEAPVFYLLDEILKGTNSEDRHKGSVSLVEQLSKNNCMGMVTTHDLALADIANDNVTNYSFNSTITGDEIKFDYTLTEGPCKSFNASKLMEKMGIIKGDTF